MSARTYRGEQLGSHANPRREYVEQISYEEKAAIKRAVFNIVDAAITLRAWHWIIEAGELDAIAQELEKELNG